MSEPYRIVQLQPAALGVTGDRGNALVLQRRLELAGETVELLGLDGGASLPPHADLVVIGNGPFSAVQAVLPDLRRVRERIAEWIEAGVPLLAVGAGFEVLGHEVRHGDGQAIEGLGLLPVRVDHGAVVSARATGSGAAGSGERHVGYVATDSPVGELIGFEDWRGTTTLDAGAEPLGRVTRGVTGTKGMGDGVRRRNAVGTRLQGPVLPLNPAFADWLIGLAAARRHVAYAPGAAHAELDRLAAGARDVILRHIDHPFTHI